MPDKLLTPTRAASAADVHAEKTTRAAGRWVWVSRTIFAVLIVGVLAFGFFLAAANAAQRQELSETSDRLAESQAEAAALYEQLLAAGEEPVVEPSDDEGPGEIGPQGVPGIQGVPGEDGADGRPPTAEEVLAAVNAYCVSIGGCRGADGTDGTNGQPGAPGESIVGPAGPAGADGQPGAPGANGSDGRGIASISCVLNDDLSTAFHFTFTDGTTTDVPGACLP